MTETAASEQARDPKQTLTGHEVAAALLDDWRVMIGGLQARYRTGDFATGLKLVAAIGEAAEKANHHPDVDLRYPAVLVRLSSHDVQGITQRDVDLAREISRAADRLGATPEVDGVQRVEWALDTHDHAEIKPFWAAVLGLEENPTDDVELTDPDGVLPTLWFQSSERPEGGEAPAQRWHADVWVPPEVAERRVRAAVEAGGTLVSDERAPAFWVLADAQGNRVCFCTWLGRAVSPDELPPPEQTDEEHGEERGDDQE